MPISLSSFSSTNNAAPNQVTNIHSGRTKIQAAKLDTCISEFKKYLHLPDDYEAVKVILAATAANYFPGNAVWLMLIAPSGGGKSTLLASLQKLPNLFNLGSMTEPFLLGSQRDNDDAPGFLNESIQDFGIITLREFGCVLSTHEKSMKGLLNTMRQIHDGEIVRGIAGKKLLWKGKCGFIAAGTTAVDSHRDVISEMGERFVYYRIKYSDEDELLAGRLASKHSDRNPLEIHDELADVVEDCIGTIVRKPPKITLTDDEFQFIEACSRFAARARTPIDRNSSYSRDMEEVHELEFHMRLQHEMTGWFRAALAIGVDYKLACNLLKKITFHTVPLNRMRVLQVMFDSLEPGDNKYFDGGLATLTRRLGRNLRHGATERSVKRAVEDLEVLDILEPRPATSRRSRKPLSTSEDKSSGRPSVAAWRPKRNVWELYAEIQSFDSKDPRS